MIVMTIQAVVFDIGGVLEITPDLGVTEMRESRLGLVTGEPNNAWPTPGVAAPLARSAKMMSIRQSRNASV